jgi:hypothetical protein
MVAASLKSIACVNFATRVPLRWHERERNRQADRQADRQTDRKKERDKAGNKERETVRRRQGCNRTTETKRKFQNADAKTEERKTHAARLAQRHFYHISCSGTFL